MILDRLLETQAAYGDRLISGALAGGAVNSLPAFSFLAGATPALPAAAGNTPASGRAFYLDEVV